MKLSVFWLEYAENKLEDIYSYYCARASETIAKKLVLGIIDRTINLEDQPESGQLEPLLDSRDEGFRYLVFKNYKIIYWINVEKQRVEIVNVFDTRQNPIKMKKQSRK